MQNPWFRSSAPPKLAMVWMPVIPELRRQEKEKLGVQVIPASKEKGGGREEGRQQAGRQRREGRAEGQTVI